jgi:glyoxylase-like metal-dependent hydrolase (beta-lactamase superfamily II)
MFQRLPLVALATVVALAVAPGAARQAAAQLPEPVITPISGDLYQIRSGSQVTVFLAAPAGIVLIDPLGADTAMWLKGEFAQRFPNVPVRYVVYTSHDFERASGGAVFDETAEIIAHENFELAQRRTVLMRGPGATFTVKPPESTYRLRRTLRLDGRTIELVHPGAARSADETVIYFPEERIVFAADPVIDLPASLLPAPREFVAWLRTVVVLAFDTLISGRGDTYNHRDITTLREYVELLAAEVRADLFARTRQPPMAGASLDRFRQLPSFARRSDHLLELRRAFRVFSADVYGAADFSYHPTGTYCSEGPFWLFEPPVCGGMGGPSGGGTVGVSFSVGRGGIAVELSTGRRLARDWRPTDFRYVDERDDDAIAVLGRYALIPERPVGITLIAGATVTRGRTSRSSQFTGARPPSSPPDAPDPFTWRSSEPGLIAGVDIEVPLANRVSIALPLRVTRDMLGDDGFESWGIGAWGVRAGAGLRFSVVRRVQP